MYADTYALQLYRVHACMPQVTLTRVCMYPTCAPVDSPMRQIICCICHTRHLAMKLAALHSQHLFSMHACAWLQYTLEDYKSNAAMRDMILRSAIEDLEYMMRR